MVHYLKVNIISKKNDYNNKKKLFFDKNVYL